MSWLSTTIRRYFVFTTLHHVYPSPVQLLVRDSHTPSYWYRYGVFSLRMREFDRAEQCFKQAISLDQQYVPG